MLDGRELYTRDGAPGSIHDLPAKWTGWYGEKVDLKAPTNTILMAYDAGKLRSYESIAGAYRRDYTSGDKPEIAAWGKYAVTATMTYYYDWDDAPYDGFIGK